MQENSQSFVDSSLENPKISKKTEKANAFNLSIIAVLIVVIIGGIFTGLNFMTQQKISQVSQKITAEENKIAEAKKQKTVIIASMLEQNNLKETINLKNLITDFKQAAKEANVQFQGFSIKDSAISTNLISRSSTKEDAVGTIIKMMQSYEKNNSQKNFALDPILSVSGTPQNRTTPVTFKVISVAEKNQNSNN